MKKLNENTKVTLTLGQLKKLVKESVMKPTVTDETVELAMDFAKAMENVPDGLYNAISADEVENGKDCIAVVKGMLKAAKACEYTFGSDNVVTGLQDFITRAELFLTHWEDELSLGEYSRELGESTASGPTCEESLDQISADAQKAKEAYLNGENSEASDIVFKIIKDARNVSNRLTETTGGPLVESNQGLVDQVLEDPRVQMAAEQFVNCLIENVVTAPTFRTANPHAPMLSDLISSADDIRWKRVVSAINLVKMNYKGAK